MADIKKLAKIWTYIHSSSINNFHEKLTLRLGLQQKYQLFGPVIFIGMYHWVDYFKFVVHQGPSRVFWCGSDILNLKKSRWKNAIAGVWSAEHFCENEVEQKELQEMGIYADVIPMIFDNPDLYQPCFKPVAYPNVWMCAHQGREDEYGVSLIRQLARDLPDFRFHIFGIDGDDGPDNLFYHGTIDENEFNKRIREYQISIRPNVFDGFSEVTAKSILLGQYPLTYIRYPDISWYNNYNAILAIFEQFKSYVEPNILSENWRERLEQSKQILTK